MQRRFSWGGVLALAGSLVFLLAALPAAEDPPRFTPWSDPVNLGSVVNSSYADAGVYLSRDGLSLYFGSARPGGVGPTNTMDIWVSHREGIGEPWGQPVNLGSPVNTADNEQTPTLTLDGHRLYFARDGLGGYGSQDLYVSRRQHNWDDIGWREPANLGPGVNTTSEESGPSLFEDDTTGLVTLYFSSTRSTGFGCEDIYASTAYPDEEFGPAELVPMLNTPSRDVRPFVRRDGLEMFFDSNRPSSSCSSQPDIWTSSRPTIWTDWSETAKLPGAINSTGVDARPVVSFDGTELYFHSNRLGTLGGNDIYVSTRTRIKGRGPS